MHIFLFVETNTSNTHSIAGRNQKQRKEDVRLQLVNGEET